MFVDTDGCRVDGKDLTTMLITVWNQSQGEFLVLIGAALGGKTAERLKDVATHGKGTG